MATVGEAALRVDLRVGEKEGWLLNIATVESTGFIKDSVQIPMPQFVVLAHDHPVLHWDFMLEDEDHLRTWRLARLPDTRGDIEAEPLSGHRKLYLNYEGAISGNRGTVKCWDRGEYSLVEQTPMKCVVDLAGAKLRGTAVISANQPGGSALFRFEAT
jgi:hypothetical protein